MEKKNFINLNGREIMLTEEQIREMAKSLGVKQVSINGETALVGEYEFIVLERSGDTVALLLKDCLGDDVVFGDNNNYVGSNVEKICNEFAEKIEAIVGKENLVEHTVDLTADDGLKCYGSVKRKISLLTTDLYRRYVYTLDKFKLDKWWWLATPWSTPKHDTTTTVKCVSPSGNVDYYYGFYDRYGVRPFCILKSIIFES